MTKRGFQLYALTEEECALLAELLRTTAQDRAQRLPYTPEDSERNRHLFRLAAMLDASGDVIIVRT